MKTILKNTASLLTALVLLAVVLLPMQGCRQQDNLPNESEEEAEQHWNTQPEWPIEEPINPRADETGEELGQWFDEPADELVESTE